MLQKNVTTVQKNVITVSSNSSEDGHEDTGIGDSVNVHSYADMLVEH